MVPITVFVSACTDVRRALETADSTSRDVRTERLRIEDINEKERQFLLIFVHGYNSSSDEAWGNFPKLILEQKNTDFANFNVTRYGYVTSACNNKNTIADRGEELASYLKSVLDRYQGAIVVGHSMGGLVVLQALAKLDRDQYARLEKIPIHVMTFGTPYLGVQGADMARNLGFLCPDAQADDMHLFGSNLRLMRDSWDSRFGPERSKYHVSVQAYFAPEDNFVHRDSACGSFHCESVDGNHLTIVKPNDSKHLTYAKLVEQVAAMRKPLAFLDLIIDGPTKYLLTAERTSSEPLSDPQGGLYYLCEVKIKMKRGQDIIEKKINDFYLPASPEGAMTLTEDHVKIFLSSKARTQDGTFGMNGSFYSIDRLTLQTKGVVPVFHNQNSGWYPWFDGNSDVVHFSFHGYLEIKHATIVGPIQQTTAIARHQDWLAKHSNGLLPATNPADIRVLFQ